MGSSLQHQGHHNCSLYSSHQHRCLSTAQSAYALSARALSPPCLLSDLGAGTELTLFLSVQEKVYFVTQHGAQPAELHHTGAKGPRIFPSQEQSHPHKILPPRWVPRSQDGTREHCEFRCSRIEACTGHRPSSMHEAPKQVRDGSRAEPEPVPLQTCCQSSCTVDWDSSSVWGDRLRGV